MGKPPGEDTNSQGKATKIEDVDDNVVPMDRNADTAGAAPAAPPEPTAEEKLAALEKDFLYLRAEMENYKRHAIQERSHLVKFGAERLAKDLLDTLDIFHQAFETETTAENFQQFIEGIKMTRQQLISTLERHGIKEVPSIGQQFDPTTHEALGAEVSADVKPGHITRVFKSPYKYHDKLLRAGQVFVAQEKPKDKE